MAVLARAKKLGCNCLQIFAANPRSWQGQPVSQSQAQAFLAAAPKSGVKALVIHAIYLVNLASPKPEVRKHSLLALQRDLVSAQRLRAVGIIVHPGSDLGDGQGEARLLAGLKKLLPHLPLGCRILLETMAGQKNSLGDLATLGRLCARLGEGIGVCLDTAHLFAAGFDLTQDKSFLALMRAIKQQVGFKRVGCVHLNDSKSPCNSRRDYHENLGEGYIGRPGLSRVLGYHSLRPVPMIIETPGFDQMGPDAMNMRRLHRLAKLADKAENHGNIQPIQVN